MPFSTNKRNKPFIAVSYTHLYEKDFWQRERYEKTTFALNNFDEEKQKKWLYRKFEDVYKRQDEMDRTIYPDDLKEISPLFNRALTGEDSNTRLNFRQRNVNGEDEWLSLIHI